MPTDKTETIIGYRLHSHSQPPRVVSSRVLGFGCVFFCDENRVVQCYLTPDACRLVEREDKARVLALVLYYL